MKLNNMEPTETQIFALIALTLFSLLAVVGLITIIKIPFEAAVTEAAFKRGYVEGQLNGKCELRFPEDYKFN
jgi:hypothetical protein